MESKASIETPGATIAGRYRVERLLGRGGMAAVYRARDERTGRRLAIKRCWAREPSKRKRQAALLEREFHTLAQLAHPLIIAVYDYGVDEGGPYYTMELLEDNALEQAERLPWRVVCAVLRDVASSLAILHSRGLIHRDVSLRNVHGMPDGRVKLLDFGAMTSIGVAKDVVGTAPFMAPEVVQLQALDARVDLFSLGALAYRLLTGRHAYSARRVADLRDAWRSRPAPPTSIVADVPAELSRLTLQLLSLDRGRRPQAAAEVIERVRALAGLAPDDTIDVTRAYLTMPVLVGREPALVAVRQRMLSLARGDGGLLLVRGEAGSGRSRLLDACALEGKLLGASLVRADASDASQGDWGVARALGNQLLEQFPEPALDAARLTRGVLGELFEELRGEVSDGSSGSAPDRSVLIRALRDWMLALSKVHRLLIIVDDVDRVDEPSIALLSALANRSERHPLLLALATERSSRSSLAGPLRLLDDVGQAIELEDLQPSETEALIRSLFGDVPNLSICATCIHGLSHGNPRAAMELAQHLVDTRRARYEAGSWSLPRSLDELDLPRTLATSLAARIAELSADARELASALALADEDALGLEFYPLLAEHADGTRAFRALDELVAARILIPGADRYAFVQRGFVPVLEDSLSPELRSAMHVRIARLLASRGGDVLRRAHHLFAAERDAEAVELLSSTDLQTLYPSVELLKRAIASAERLAIPAAALHRLRMTLLIHAPLSLDYAALRDVYGVVLRQLERDAGLTRYRQLDHLPQSERLAEALRQTQQVYDSTPENERVHPVVEAVRELARLCGAVTAMSVTTFDLDLLETLPALDPLFPLSPTLPVIAQIVEGGKYWISGRVLRSRAFYAGVRARLAEPDRAGFDPSQHERARFMLDYGIGLAEATFGIESAEEYASALEAHREVRMNAWRIRALLQLAIGNVTEARKCARRSELLEAQDGLRERYGGSTIGIELGHYARLGDLLGIKGLLERLSVMAARYRGWQPLECFARARYCELQGDAEGALRHIETGLALLPPLRHPFWVALAAGHVRVLITLSRVVEAAEHARSYMRLCSENDLAAPDVMMAAAAALERTGDCEAARSILEAEIEWSERLGRAGFALGAMYEARARLAIGMRDRAAFDHFAGLCAVQYAHAKNPALGAQLERLHEAAEAAGVRERGAVDEVVRAMSTPPESEADSIHSRMSECVDASDRARCALTLLLQSTSSATGYLYAVGPDRRLTLIAALPDVPDDLELERWVEQRALACCGGESMEVITAADTTVSETNGEPGGSDSGSTVNEAGGAQDAAAPWYEDGWGRTLEAVPLFDERAERRCLSGMLVVLTLPTKRALPPRALCATIARELLDHGDAAAFSPV